MYKTHDGKRVYEKKDFDLLAKVLKDIENPLAFDIQNLRFMCEDIEKAMCSDDGIVVKEIDGEPVVTYEHNV